MCSDKTRGGPWQEGPPRHDQHPAKSTDPRSLATVARAVAPVIELAAYRELRAWVAAVECLNARGLAAAVPASLVPVMRRRGLAVWPAASRSVA